MASSPPHRNRVKGTKLCCLQVDEEEQEQLEEDMKLLDPKLNAAYNNIVEFYGDLLYRWKLMEKRTEVT